MADIGTSTVAYATRQTTGQLVFIASDGAACVLWHDGTNQVIAYDDSTYASWTKATHTTAMNMVLAGDFRAGTDNIDTVTGYTSNVRGYYTLLTKSGATWTVGTRNGLSGTTAIGVASQGAPCVYAGQDAQGRHWIAVAGATNTATTCYYSAANSPTTTGWTASGAVTQTADLFTPAAGQVGNYLVYIYWNGTALQWRRVDNSAASVGSWTTAATITGLTGSPNASHAVKFQPISATQGLLTYSSGSGVYAQLYTAATDTWGAATQLSSGANDRHPTIAVDGAGKAWVIWCSYVAANNFALLYKQYNGSTWDAGATTLVASGTNINYPNAGFGAKTIGVTYTQGTASPYTVGWATIPLGGSRAISGVTAALSGPMALVLYGSATPDATLTTACDMVSATTGGVEVAKGSTFTGAAGNFAEVWSKGNAGVATVAAIPATPTGNGWVYTPGAGTFASGNWSAIVTEAVSVPNAGNHSMRFFRLPGGVLGSAVLIGTLTVTPTATAKTTYSLAAVSMGSVTFAATDVLYIDYWYQSIYGPSSDTCTMYEATTSAAGVTNEMQVTTAIWTAAVGATTSTRPITSVSAAVQALDVAHPITGVSAATQALDIEKPLGSISASVSPTVTTYSRTISGVSTAVQALGVPRTVVGVSGATQAFGLTRSVVGVSGATKALGLTRPVVSLSASLLFTGSRPVTGISTALLASQIARPVSGVSASLLFTGARPVTGVSAATKALGIEHPVASISASIGQGGIERTISGISASTKAFGVTRPVGSISGAMQALGITRPIGSVSASVTVPTVTSTRTITGVSTAVQALGLTRNVTGIASATQALGLIRPISGVSVAVGVGGLSRSITGVSAATKAFGVTRDLTSISAATQTLGLTRPIVNVSASAALTHTRTITGVSSTIKALGVERPTVSVSASTKAFGVTRSLINVSGAIGQGGISRTISGVSATLQALGVARNSTSVSLALQAIGVTRSLVEVSGAVKQIGLTRDITGVSGTFAQTVRKTLTPLSGAVQATVSRPLTGISGAVTLRSTRTITGVSTATKAFGVTRPITGILAAIGVAGITKGITGVSASLFFSGKVYTYVTVVGTRGNVTVEGARGNVTVEGTRGTMTVQEE